MTSKRRGPLSLVFAINVWESRNANIIFKNLTRFNLFQRKYQAKYRVCEISRITCETAWWKPSDKTPACITSVPCYHRMLIVATEYISFNLIPI